MGDFQDGERNNDDSEVEYDAQETTDTSALEYRNGKDIQGIPWEKLNHSREKYREIRLKEYKNYENLPRFENELDKECRMVQSGHTFYDFQFNTRLVKPTIMHFQIVIIGTFCFADKACDCCEFTDAYALESRVELLCELLMQ